jgi:hypothetical protein
VDAPVDEPGDTGPYYLGFLFKDDDTFLRLVTNNHETLGSVGRITTPGLDVCVYYKSWQTGDGFTSGDNIKAFFTQVKDIGGEGFQGPTESYAT